MKKERIKRKENIHLEKNGPKGRNLTRKKENRKKNKNEKGEKNNKNKKFFFVYTSRIIEYFWLINKCLFALIISQHATAQ